MGFDFSVSIFLIFSSSIFKRTALGEFYVFSTILLLCEVTRKRNIYFIIVKETRWRQRPKSKRPTNSVKQQHMFRSEKSVPKEGMKDLKKKKKTTTHTHSGDHLRIGDEEK